MIDFTQKTITRDLARNETYDTNLVAFNKTTGDIVPVKIFIGPQHGFYVVLGDCKISMPHDMYSSMMWGHTTYLPSVAKHELYLKDKIGQELTDYKHKVTKRLDTHQKGVKRAAAMLSNLKKVEEQNPEYFI